MTERIGDAMRRGALSHGRGGVPDVDFMAVDWFELAPMALEEAQKLFGITDKSDLAVAAGSVTAWMPGGISEAQMAMGQAHAERLGIKHDTFGATV